MGLGWTIAAGAGGAGDALQQLIAQKHLEQQTAFNNRHTLTEEQQNQQRLDQQDRERRDTLAETAYQHQLLAKSRAGEDAMRLTADLSPGDVLDPSQSGALTSGNLGSLITHQTPTLPSTAMAGAMPLPGGPQESGAVTTTQNPGNPAQDVYRGTSTQRQAEQQRQALGKLVTGLAPGSRERQGLEFFQATGKEPPASLFEKTDAIGDGNYSLNGKPIVAQKTKAGRIVYQGNDVTDRVQPFTATPNPQPEIFEGPDGKLHSVQFVGGKVANDTPLPEGYRKPNATLDNRLASAEAVTQVGNDIIAKLSDPAYADTLGPAMGRYSSLRDFLGAPPPEFSDLAGSIRSYATGSMGVHGMRSAQGADEIVNLLNGRHTPASLAAAIRGLNGFGQHLIQNAGHGGGAAAASSGGGAAPQAPAGWKYVPKPGGGWTAVEAK